MTLCVISLWERTSSLGSRVSDIAPESSHEYATTLFNADTSSVGIWAEVWTADMTRTPYKVFVLDDADADRQLDLLSETIGHP